MAVTLGALAQVSPDDNLTELVCALYTAYAKPICAYIHSLVGDWQLAHDLTQETYLQLYRTRQRLPQVENQRAWVYGIASHLAFNELKRRRRFIWLPWQTGDEERGQSWLTVEDEVARRDRVACALAELPLDYRAPLILYSSYDFSAREIGETLGISEAAVRQRLHRAREMFRRAYKQSEE